MRKTTKSLDDEEEDEEEEKRHLHCVVTLLVSSEIIRDFGSNS